MVYEEVVFRTALSKCIDMRMFNKYECSGLLRNYSAGIFLKTDFSVDDLSENTLLQIPCFLVRIIKR